jgi:hypothetical protein
MHQDIKTVFKKFFQKRPTKSKQRFGADPYQDWQKMLIVFLVINFIVLIGSGYLFLQINQGNIFEVAPAKGPDADQTTRANLKNVLTIYDAREKHFEDLRTQKPVTQDPAI